MCSSQVASSILLNTSQPPKEHGCAAANVSCGPSGVASPMAVGPIGKQGPQSRMPDFDPWNLRSFVSPFRRRFHSWRRMLRELPSSNGGDPRNSISPIAWVCRTRQNVPFRAPKTQPIRNRRVQRDLFFEIIRMQLKTTEKPPSTRHSHSLYGSLCARRVARRDPRRTKILPGRRRGRSTRGQSRLPPP